MSGSGSSCFALVEDDFDWAGATAEAPVWGLPRLYDAWAWYAASIERQVRSANLEALDQDTGGREG